MAKRKRKLKKKRRTPRIGTARLRGKAGEAKKVEVVAVRERLGVNFREPGK
tara:strand:- start:1096 stop:1248 length:153 start_codon:yes stop_codon:yes gene_type:complete